MTAESKAINLGVAPATYGQGTRPPRGNYAAAKADYTCDQLWEDYTPSEHDLYCRLHERQSAQLSGLACAEFIESAQKLGTPNAIPRFDQLSEQLYKATRWQIVAVPGLIPEEAFFSLLANRKFPATTWLRRPDEFDYIVEPDVFHDLFGHAPLLFHPMFADYMQAYGQGGLKAAKLQKCEYLARLYWHTVEFGLIKTKDGIRAYGAGILSSGGELRHSVTSQEPYRVRFDLERIMRTKYVIDAYQPNYFVIDSFKDLMDCTRPDFTPIYERVSSAQQIAAGARLPVDVAP